MKVDSELLAIWTAYTINCWLLYSSFLTIFYYQLYAINIYLFNFCLFAEIYLENPMYESARTKKKIRCSEHLRLTHTHDCWWFRYVRLYWSPFCVSRHNDQQWILPRHIHTHVSLTVVSHSWSVWRIFNMKFVYDNECEKSVALNFTR